MLKKSRRAWVGCSPGPSPPLMIGTGETAAALAAAPRSWCLITIASA
jgi:hypothetical protein